MSANTNSPLCRTLTELEHFTVWNRWLAETSR